MVPPGIQAAQPDQTRHAAMAAQTQRAQDPQLTPLGTKPGVKQNILYALREFQTSVLSMFKGSRPAAPVTTGPRVVQVDHEPKVGVVLAPDDTGQSVSGFLDADHFVSFSEAAEKSKEKTETGRTFGNLLRAIRVGHRARLKGEQQKIGSKLYVDEGILRRQTGVLFKGRTVEGHVITPEGYRERSKSLSELALSRPESRLAQEKLEVFETRLRALSVSVPAYKEILDAHEAAKAAALAAGLLAKQTALFESLKADLEGVSIPEPDHTSFESLKESYKALQETDTLLKEFKTNLNKTIVLTREQVEALEEIKLAKRNEVLSVSQTVTNAICDRAVDHVTTLDKTALLGLAEDGSSFTAELLAYGAQESHLADVHVAITSLSDFATQLTEKMPTAYTHLAPTLRKEVLGAYQKGAFFVGNPESHLFLSRLSQVCSASDSARAETFVRDMVHDVVSGNVETLFMIQDHAATATMEAISDSAHLDPIVANVLQKTLSGDALDKAKIKHALRLCARHLCRELAPALGLKKAPSVLFDAKTINALTSHPDIHVPTLDVVLGQVLILQHELTPFPDLDAALKEAGIHIPADRISSMFDQGVRSSDRLDKILNSLSRFSESMGKQPAMRSLLDSVFEDDPSAWAERYETLVFSKQMNASMATELRAQNKHMLGRKVELGTAKLRRTKIGKVAIPGAFKDAVVRRIWGETSVSSVMGRLNALHDQKEVLLRGRTHSRDNQVFSHNPGLKSTCETLLSALDEGKSHSLKRSRVADLESVKTMLQAGSRTGNFSALEEALPKLLKRNAFKTMPDFVSDLSLYMRNFKLEQLSLGLTETVMSARDEMGDRIETQLAQLDRDIEALFTSAEKSFQPIVEMIRLCIVQISTSEEGDAVIEALQNGTHSAEIEDMLNTYGLTPEALREKGIDDPHALRGLIQRECSRFEGRQQFRAWSEDVTIDSRDERALGLRRESLETPEVRQILGIESPTHTETASKLSSMKAGEKFSFSWGKSVMVEVPSEVELAEQVLGGGVSVGASVAGGTDRQFWVEKVSTEAGEGFNVYLGKEVSAKLGLNFEFLAGVITADLGVGASKAKGVRLHFGSEEAATHFIASVMLQQTDAAALGKADLILEDRGHALAVSAGATFQIPNPLDGFLSNIDPPIDALGDVIEGFKEMKIEVGVAHESTRNTSQNLHQKTVEKTKAFRFGFDMGLFKHCLPLEGEYAISGSLEVSVATTQSMATRFDVLADAHTSHVVSVEATGPTTKAQQLYASLYMAGVHRSPEFKSDTFQASLKALLNQAEPGDAVRVDFQLKPDIRLQLCEMMDPSSAKYDPKRAKSMLSDKENYGLASIELLREHAEDGKGRSISAAGVTYSEHSHASRYEVVGRI